MNTHISELDTLLQDLNRARFCSFPPDDTATGQGVLASKPVPPVTPQTRRDSLSTSPSPTRNNNNNNMWAEKHDTAGETKQPLLNKGGVSDDDEYEGDYSSKWEYLGKGIWENQDYGTLSGYSTLRSGMATGSRDLDYETLSRSGIVSEEELEKETGAGPRGDRSRYIETDVGTVQSKYRYMGFGLWENLDPNAPKKMRRPKPPPPPPKAEPIWYNCTVTVSSRVNTKELDDLVTTDIYTYMESRDEWVSVGGSDLMEDKGEAGEMLDKEDMTDMFSRAMLEKMQPEEIPRSKYRCYVCTKLIEGRVITAMGNKFHPECFVCTYCRGPFRDRKYKTDPRENHPYCLDCFDKLLGHFGNIHSAHG